MEKLTASAFKRNSNLENLFSRIYVSPVAQKKDFPEGDLQRALNLIIYGCSVTLLRKTKKSVEVRDVLLYLNENSFAVLECINEAEKFICHLDLGGTINLSDFTTIRLAESYANRRHLMLNLNFANQQEVLLFFKTEENKRLCWQGFQYLILIHSYSSERNAYERMIEKYFLKADTNNSKNISYQEIKQLLLNLHIEIGENYLKKIFVNYDKNKNGSLEKWEFEQFFSEISEKKEMKPLFHIYSHFAKENTKNSDPVMTHFGLKKFFMDEQKQDFPIEIVLKILNYFSGNEEETDEKFIPKLSFNLFCNILFSEFNCIYDLKKIQAYQTFSRPLTDYFVSSSHNTYLMGHQLYGESSVTAYINCLARGCRCLEIDCWDGENGEPIVYHGYTLTSKILFKDVIQVIKDTGFTNNTLPIILSLEIHCNFEQRMRMGHIMTEILGDSLYRLPKDFTDHKTYPSPESLRNKVVIKAKASLSYKNKDVILQDTQGDIEQEVYDDPFVVMEECKTFEKVVYVDKLGKKVIEDEFLPKFNQKLIQKEVISEEVIPDLIQVKPKKAESDHKTVQNIQVDKSKKSYDLIKNNSNVLNIILPFLKKPHDKESDRNESPESLKKGRNANSAPEQIVNVEERRIKGKTKIHRVPLNFYRCITMFGVPFNYQDKARTIWDISSMKEDKIVKLFDHSIEKIQSYHKRNLSRVYPSPFRTDSSNYDPTFSWASGVQFAALNYQTPDIYMLMNLGKFLENGGISSGYLLKPEYMLGDSKNIIIKRKTTLSIKVICAQQLRMPEKVIEKNNKEKNIKSTIDPYFSLYIKGLPEDEKRNKIYKSAHVNNNGFNPSFTAIEYTFEVHNSEFAFIIFEVWNKNKLKDDRLGWNAVPIDCIAEGYRTVPLRDNFLDIIEFSYLFVHVTLTRSIE